MTETLSPQMKMQNAQQRLSEIESEIAGLQARHDAALAQSLDRVKRNATGEGDYPPAEMEADRADRDRLQANIRELREQADAVEALIPDLERDHAVTLAHEARHRQSESAERANALATKFHAELLQAADTWTQLCRAHADNRRESERIFDRTAEAGGHVELPPAAKFDHAIDALQRIALEAFKTQ